MSEMTDGFVVNDDLELYKQKKLIGKSEKCFIGSKSVDMSCEASEELYIIMEKLLYDMKQNLSFDEMQTIINSHGYNIESKKLYEKLSLVGLTPKNNISLIRGEANFFMKKIYNIKVDNTKLLKLNRQCLIFVFFIYIIIIASSVGISVLYFTGKCLHGATKVSALTYITAGLISALFHELMHVLAALSCKMKIDKISISFYLSIIPLMYVKVKNVYFHSSKKRFIYIFSGIAGNIFLMVVAAFINMLGYYNSFLYVIVLINTSMILGNLMPLAYGDGYFIMAEIIGKHNLRLSLLKRFVLGKKSRKINAKEKAYVIVLSIYIIINVTGMISVLYKMFTSGNTVLRAIGICLLFVANILMIVRGIRKVLMKRKEVMNIAKNN